ncbi:hypothetical protein [Halomonas borealis]|uniref:hypothetical protein n=1 Tax=Halomonas borealis TaxID=2508710 RepID=UPI0010A015FB|nr:hypothetical protein [Halomonas borealis]
MPLNVPRRGARMLIPGCLALLLGGCQALSQAGLPTFQPKVTSLDVEDIRLDSRPLDAGSASDLGSLIATSLGSGSLPVQATMAMGLELPAGLPAMQMDGFDWRLDMPGLDSVGGRYDQRVALTPGDDSDLRLPLAFDLLQGDRDKLAPLLDLARQMVRSGELPTGSELSITPGGLSGLGVSLPSGLLAPTLRLVVGEDGTLRSSGAQPSS